MVRFVQVRRLKTYSTNLWDSWPPVFLIKRTNTNNDRLTTPCHSDLAPVRLQVKNPACSLPRQDEYIECSRNVHRKNWETKWIKIHLHHLIIFKLPRQIPLHPFLPSLLNPRISTGSANGEFATQGISQGMRRICWDDQNLFERQGWMYTRMSHLDGEEKNA